MIVSVAIVTGFQQEIRAKVIGFGAHIQISNHDDNHSLETEALDINAEYVSKVLAISGVDNIQAVASKPGIIKSGDAIEGVVYKGFASNYNTKFLQQHLVRGRLPAFPADEASKEVLISSTHARLLGLDVDSSFIMYFVQDPPKARKFSISGIYNTGLGEQEFDKRFIFGDLRVVQKLNRWEANQAGALEVNLKDFKRLDEFETIIYQMIPANLTADSITRRYPQIFSWLELMDTNVYIIITLMMLVSVINMITSLLIMILERTRTIGILKTLGGTNGLIIKIFLRQAAAIIGTGLLAGNILGIGFCLFQQETGLVSLNQETYYLSVVPIRLELWHLLALNAFCFVVCMIILLLPAWIVTRIRPARVIRFD
jgi:lipoprotein-releasing system permease protein